MLQTELKTVARAAEVLKCFSLKSVWTLTEISTHLSISKSMVHRLLRTLANYDLVEIDTKTRQVRVGPMIHEISHADTAGPRIVNFARHLIAESAAEIEETVAFCRINGMEGLCILSVDSVHAIRMSIQDGERFALNAGAIGKVLLAFQSTEFIEEFLAKSPFYKYTANTPANSDELRLELDSIRRVGAARSVAEITEGASSISVPIFDPDGGVTYCIAASGPTARFVEGRQDQVGKILRRIAGQLSELLTRTEPHEVKAPKHEAEGESENVV